MRARTGLSPASWAGVEWKEKAQAKGESFSRTTAAEAEWGEKLGARVTEKVQTVSKEEEGMAEKHIRSGRRTGGGVTKSKGAETRGRREKSSGPTNRKAIPRRFWDRKERFI